MAVYVPVTVKVTDSVTNNPIVGAQVFINGSANFDPTQFTVVTDSTGRASFQIPLSVNPAFAQMQITASNYQSYSNVVPVNAAVPQNFNVQLTSTVTPNCTLTFQFDPAVPGIMWQLFTVPGDVLQDQSVSTQDGSSPGNSPEPYGTYTVQAQYSGYANLNQTITLNQPSQTINLLMIKNADSGTTQVGNNGPDSSPLQSQPSSIVSQTTFQAPNPSEYIYPNSDYDKYFTVTGARMYIGNLFIDELNSVSWALQDNAIPVYGYASRYPDAYGQGRSLVQGQLTINFVTEGYLYTVLQEYKRFLSSTQQGNTLSLIGDPQVDLVAQTLGLISTRNALTQQMNAATDPTVAASFENRAALIQGQITNLMNAMSPDQISTLNANLEKQLNSFNNVVAFDNAVYQDVIFDIRVELGNESNGVKRVRYLEKCKLISNEQVISQDGQVLLDSYGFIARRLR